MKNSGKAKIINKAEKHSAMVSFFHSFHQNLFEKQLLFLPITVITAETSENGFDGRISGLKLNYGKH